ncbi:MAG TPA: chaplin family protein [Acidimicrobiales bacterium]|nr:chaplin family protein [Acidimicrobiales bacterium]
MKLRAMHYGLKRPLVAVAAVGALTFAGAATPAYASTQQSGLVNVALTGNTVQVPIGIAADICGVQANVIATNNFVMNTFCTSASRSSASGGSGGGGSTAQQGLVNVAVTNNTVQVPIGIAATVCGVQANLLAAGNVQNSSTCSSVTRAGAA